MSLTTPPKEIYLLWYDEDGEAIYKNGRLEGEVTWCEDRINSTDVKYVIEENAFTEEELILIHDALFSKVQSNRKHGISDFDEPSMSCFKLQNKIIKILKEENNDITS